MRTYQTLEIKNIAILGSSGSGKTTLSEAMLYEAGIIKRRGSITAKNTVSDYLTVEKEYGYSVFSSIFSVEWMDRKLNFIDCPDAEDFIGDVVTSLHVTDTALMVLNAQHGLEVGTINQLRYTRQLNKPVIFVVNQLDQEKADFDMVVNQLKSRYGDKAVLVQYPLNQGEDFNAMIDVLKMKMYRWKPEGGVPEVLEVPEEEREKAEALRKRLIEAAAEHEESLMEQFFEKETLTEEEMRFGIRKGLISRDIFPIFCVCAKRDMAVRRTMEFLGNVVPYSVDMPIPVDTDGDEIFPDASKPTNIYIFKSTTESHVGEISYFKVMSGRVKEGDDFINANRGSKERIGQLYVVDGQIRTSVPEMFAGDIGATIKLKDVRTGNTLNGKGAKSRFDFIKYPEPKYRSAIKAVNERNTEKLFEALNRLHQEDPTWIIEQSKELRQTIVWGQGEFHLDTLKWRLENEDKIEIEFSEPRIPYRETITKAARSDYRHKKQSGGAGQFGEVHMIVEPYVEGMEMPQSYKFNGQEYKISLRDVQTYDLEWGGKLIFVNSIVGGAIDTRFVPAIVKGVIARLEQGPLTGSYARDVRVIVYDGKMHPVDSNEISFMLAGRNAFSEAFRNAGPKILEPIYDLTVFVPSDKMGDVMSDLQMRRAMILGMESDHDIEILKARIPLKELSNYSTILRSLTQGRASFVMKFAQYELVPSDIQDKLLKEYEASKSEED